MAQTYQTCWSHGQLRGVPYPHGLSFTSLFRVHEMQGSGISSLPDSISMRYVSTQILSTSSDSGMTERERPALGTAFPRCSLIGSNSAGFSTQSIYSKNSCQLFTQLEARCC